MSEAARQGEAVDIEIHCQQYPELADELRELWGMLLVADIAGNDLEATTLMDGSDPAKFLFELPCQFGDYELQEEIGRGGMGYYLDNTVIEECAPF